MFIRLVLGRFLVYIYNSIVEFLVFSLAFKDFLNWLFCFNISRHKWNKSQNTNQKPSDWLFSYKMIFDFKLQLSPIFEILLLGHLFKSGHTSFKALRLNVKFWYWLHQVVIFIFWGFFIILGSYFFRWWNTAFIKTQKIYFTIN